MKSSAPPLGPHSKSISGQWTATWGSPGRAPRAISSMLGWVAAVRATESPSQLRPALIHRTWMTVSSVSGTAPPGGSEWAGRGVAPRPCSPARRGPYMSVFCTPIRPVPSQSWSSGGRIRLNGDRHRGGHRRLADADAAVVGRHLPVAQDGEAGGGELTVDHLGQAGVLEDAAGQHHRVDALLPGDARGKGGGGPAEGLVEAGGQGADVAPGVAVADQGSHQRRRVEDGALG